MIKRAIISGATGVIGTAVINELIKNNIEVLVLCRRDSKRNKNIPAHNLVKQQYCSLDEMAYLEPSQENYDVFFHLAWEGTTGKSREDVYLQNMNVKYALDAVKLAKSFGCRTFLGIGSQAEYGRVNEKLTPCTHTNPENAYGIGKLSAGMMTKKYSHQLGMKHIWIRVLSVYGENDNSNSLIMTVINELLAGNSPNLTKGEQIWDYLYSQDAGRAIVELAKRGIDGKVYVLGSGSSIPLRNYVEEIRDIIAPNMALNFGSINYSPNQVMCLCADITELVDDINWYPRVSFSDGIRNIIRYIDQQKL